MEIIKYYKIVVVGKDVTTLKIEGPVTIQNGKATINADNILIKNNFEIKKGAQLIIE